jgi:large subunit ribosomal protein L28
MAKCIVCGKSPQVGNSVSHANNRTKRRWIPNLQKVRIQWEGRPRMAPVCTRCLHRGKVVKAARGRHAAAVQGA